MLPDSHPRLLGQKLLQEGLPSLGHPYCCMIIYSKTAWGLPLLSRWYGSALPRTLPVALVTATYAFLLSYLWAEPARQWWLHPYAYSPFSLVLSFILVFRSNFGYQRCLEFVCPCTACLPSYRGSPTCLSAGFGRHARTCSR